jgi:hypothetical protein
MKVAKFETCWQVVEFVRHSKVAERHVQVAGSESRLKIAGGYFGDQGSLNVAKFERCWQVVDLRAIERQMKKDERELEGMDSA